MSIATAGHWVRGRAGTRPGWSLLVLVIAAAVAAPVLAVVVDAVSSAPSTRLPGGVAAMVVTTLGLMLGVAAGTLVLGGGLAWLVTAYRFPLRGLLSWALVLPLAMPAYVLGFIFLSTFDVAGPVQTGLRALFGTDVWVPPVRSLPGAVVVMTLTLYPYVYLMARAALLGQSPTAYDAARTLGASRTRAFRAILLPLSRPAIAAGLALVMMETLTDFATVQYFNVRTVSVGVYLTWKGSYDLHSANQLALLVLAFAVAVIFAERLLRGRARYHGRGGRGVGLQPRRLHGWRAALATAAGCLVLAAAFVLPVLRLATWALSGLASSEGVDPRFLDYAGNSVVLAVLVALFCVLVALLVGHAVRLTGTRLSRTAAQVTTFGYAVPGAVVGIGVLLTVAAVQKLLAAMGLPGGTGLLVTGSVVGVLFAYVVRFVAPAHQAIDAGFAKVSPSMTLSAQSLGTGPVRLLGRVHLPLLRPAATVALVLVLIDALKELPLVLLLRPFGFTTVSVWVYQLASENFWETAALPALLIVLIAIVPVAVLLRQGAR